MKTLIVKLTTLVFLSTSAFAYAFSDSQAITAFDNADKDNSNSLNKTEFKVFIKMAAKLGNVNAARAVRFGALGYRVAFGDADKNGNGSVTLEELRAIR